YAEMCEQAREQAYELLLRHARELRANAVVGVRYESSQVGRQGSATEVLCYGTAVVIQRASARDRPLPPAERHRFNFRRSLGVTICFSPVALAVWSLFAPRRQTWWVALVPLALGASIGSLNLYLTCVRPWLYRLRHHSLEGYRYVSGFPVIGTILVTLALLASAGSTPIAAVA